MDKHVDFADLGPAMDTWISDIVNVFGEEQLLAAGSEAIEHAVKISVVDTGFYKSSHDASVRRPIGANLGGPGRIPGAQEVKRAMRSWKPFWPLFVTNDAKRGEYGYWLNIEETGWPGRDPYRTYQRTLRHLNTSWPRIVRTAERRTARRTAA